MRMTCPWMMLALSFSAVLGAATPPAVVNYQGVLRDGDGAPRNGNFDMVFRFYDQAADGVLLLTDTHAAGSPDLSVAATGGLFSVPLGGGTVAAGSEPGLAEVFRDHAAVWLEIQVGTETLAPRVRVPASAYAQNATTLDGQAPSAFAAALHLQAPAAGGTGLDTSATPAGSLLHTTAAGTWSTLPGGASGQILQCTGPGMQWVDPSPVGDGDWTINGSDLHPAVPGNVGIGTTTPSSKLSVMAIAEALQVMAPALAVTPQGIGIGTAAPSATLDVEGTVHLLGAWQSRNADQLYTAESDGLVTARIVMAANGDQGCIHGFTDGTYWVSACMHQYDADNIMVPRSSFTMPVLKGETYHVSRAIPYGTPTVTVFWVPFGHGAGGAKIADGAPVPAPWAVGSDPLSNVVAAPREAALAGGKGPIAMGGTERPLIQSFPALPALEPGDVLVLDPAGGPALDKCMQAGDPRVVGVAAGAEFGVGSSEFGDEEGGAQRPAASYELPVVVAGVTTVKADATPAPIVRGDLLTTSATPGYAQKAVEPRWGTIVGRALEDLPAGTGSIRVLVALR